MPQTTTLRLFFIRWAFRWISVSLMVGILFFWRNVTGYTGALNLLFLLPVLPFTIFALLVGDKGTFIILAIVYGGLISTLFLPSSYPWAKRASLIVRNYLLAMFVLGALICCAMIGAGAGP